MRLRVTVHETTEEHDLRYVLHDGEQWVNVNPAALPHAFHPDHHVSVPGDSPGSYVLAAAPEAVDRIAALYTAKYGHGDGPVLLRLIRRWTPFTVRVRSSSAGSPIRSKSAGHSCGVDSRTTRQPHLTHVPGTPTRLPGSAHGRTRSPACRVAACSWAQITTRARHPNPRGDLRLAHGHRSPHAILAGVAGGQAVAGTREPYPGQLMTRAIPA
jgi:hypothetical protein